MKAETQQPRSPRLPVPISMNFWNPAHRDVKMFRQALRFQIEALESPDLPQLFDAGTSVDT